MKIISWSWSYWLWINLTKIYTLWKGKAFDSDYRTKKQREFLKILGLPDDVIGTIKTKAEASKWISKKSKNK